MDISSPLRCGTPCRRTMPLRNGVSLRFADALQNTEVPYRANATRRVGKPHLATAEHYCTLLCHCDRNRRGGVIPPSQKVHTAQADYGSPMPYPGKLFLGSTELNRAQVHCAEAEPSAGRPSLALAWPRLTLHCMVPPSLRLPLPLPLPPAGRSVLPTSTGQPQTRSRAGLNSRPG